MPAIITDKFRIHNSEQFHEAFSESSGNTMYLGIGRPQAFATSTRGDSRTNNEGTDTSPVTPADNINSQHFPYDDMLAAKKITSSDITFAIPRRNWTTGTVYDVYRHDYGEYATGTTTAITSNSGASTLHDATFYVLTSARNVYKCLDNNSNAASTVEPTGTDVTILETADGYRWKYMYTLSASQQANFLSTDFMAVSTNSTVSSAAVDGAINVCKIKTAGSGGTDGTHTGIAIRGDGSSGEVSVTVSSGAITAVTVTTPGTGYTFGTISNAQIVAAGATGLTGAEIDVIIEPKGGHGFNAVEELGGFYVMLNTSLEGTESANTSDFSVANDFRKITLIRDPDSGGSAASTTTLRATKAVNVTGVSGTFTVDEEINQATTGAVGKVVEWDSVNNILYYIQTRHTDEGIDSNGNLTAFSGTNVITGQSSGATGTPTTTTSTINSQSFTSGYSASEIDADSGDILYIENRAPITRAADQTENIKLVIEF
ncbi:putative baseplate protein [Pelagibacter phage Mosig EXVC030M]|nr:putative baseplate protein [Pelagibacter phage Mosig EXVC030M]